LRNESAPALRGRAVRVNASDALQLPLHSKNESVRLWRLLEGLVCASLRNGLESIPGVQRISRPFDGVGVLVT